MYELHGPIEEQPIIEAFSLEKILSYKYLSDTDARSAFGYDQYDRPTRMRILQQVEEQTQPTIDYIDNQIANAEQFIADLEKRKAKIRSIISVISSAATTHYYTGWRGDTQQDDESLSNRNQP